MPRIAIWYFLLTAFNMATPPLLVFMVRLVC